MNREEKLRETILQASLNEILDLTEELHPVDLLEVLQEYEEDQKALLEKFPDEYIAMVIDEAELDEKFILLSLFPSKQKQEIISEMSSDELADMLGNIDEDTQSRILEGMEEEHREEIEELLSFSPETAGGIMATEFVSVKETMTIDETLKFLRDIAPNAETPYYIYVLDDQDVLKGIVPIRAILTSLPDVLLKDVMLENVATIPASMDQEDVSNIFQKYGYMAMPVVDEEQVMLGIITVDDIMEVLSDEHTEDMYRLAGLDEEEEIDGSVLDSIRSRLPWLLVNLVTAILASATVSLFDATISKVVALAVFMPLVTGMGGNAGTQTLTLIIRGIALGEIDYENKKEILRKEFLVGVLHGAALGLIVAILGGLWEGNAVFGLVIGVAMFLNMVIAALSGFFIPLLLKKMGIDPALASAVFVTTMTDVLGFFFFLGFATLMLTYLL
ncbi:magnesium transporter [Proteiniclasticum sp. SCR006]|uniref:Magnesium transporter MgtE n=1 Tax=Proteiniclasticum aestuarii TaxID=2817862 RepID=A0A939KJL2_9CLOT|nr:magnesium transporter [Proteiniclasticum aestuarii]MBO1263805.1 magnesium transporter [Proteiniclasticum aestuarii]